MSPAHRNLMVLLGPVLAIGLFAVLQMTESSLSAKGQATAAIAAWMALWWLTEALPLAATALLPVALFPLLGIATPGETTAPYASSLIFLFMGGFIIGLGMQRCGLHRRVALKLLVVAGNDTRRLLGAFMLVTAGLSMWISNTAAVIMLMPIVASLLGTVTTDNPDADANPALAALGGALVLGIAYSASIGGVATLIGTPPNLILAAFLRDRYGVNVGMAEWLAIGLPYTVVMLPLCWLYLTRVAFRAMPRQLPESEEHLRQRLAEMGPTSVAEKRMLLAFSVAVGGWLFRQPLVAWTGLTGLTDAVIAMSVAIALFALPANERPGPRMMDWPTARTLPWEILLLFGGGLSLAAAIGHHGVDAALASGLEGMAGAPIVLVTLAVVALVVFLTEVTSNTAVTATLLPVLAASAVVLGVAPGPLLVAAAMSASCAFMLPVATPPNAIAFSTGQVSIGQMARVGFALNILSIALVTLVVSSGAGQGLTSP